LPIIFISGQGDVPTAVEAMRSGACHFLRKPFQDVQFLSLIDDAMRRHDRLDAATEKRAQ
jgi:FixJ family two-component response regulator